MADFNKVPQFKDELRPEGASKLLSFLIVIFSVTFIFFIGLNFGYVPLLEKRITETKENSRRHEDKTTSTV